MATQPPDPDIEHLLAELRSEAAFRRIAAAQKIAELRVSNDEIVGVLRAMAAADLVIPARKAAEQALASLSSSARPALAAKAVVKPAPPLSRREKIVEFSIGLVGWFVVNWGAWLMATGGRSVYPNDEFGLLAALWLFPLNLIVLVVLAIVRLWVSLGVLSAMALNLFIALAVGVGFAGWMFIPFFMPGLR